MRDFLISDWFSIGEWSFTYGQILFSLLFIFICLAIFYLFSARLLPTYFERIEEAPQLRKKVRRIVSYILYLSIITGLIHTLGLNFRLFQNEHISVGISALFEALLILQIARLADWVISRLVVNRYYNQRDEPREVVEPKKKKDTSLSAGQTVQFAVYIFATLLILTNFEIDYDLIKIEVADEQEKTFRLSLSNILAATLTLFIARLVAWLFTEIILYSYYKRIQVDAGSQYALNQIAKYIIYVVAIIVAFHQLGINTNLLLGGLAALLVGIGLGLQQTFNDFFSGLILLFERSVEVNDVLSVDGMIGKVRKIGVRASHVETRDNLTVVVPNSKLVSNNVINWSHQDAKARFWITVPVPYGSDTSAIREVLLKVAKNSPYVLEYPAPFIRLVDFADSSLNIELHFWSSSFMIIEDVKSDLRLQTNERLLEAGVKIPFPQRDIWIKSQPES